MRIRIWIKNGRCLRIAGNFRYTPATVVCLAIIHVVMAVMMKEKELKTSEARTGEREKV